MDEYSNKYSLNQLIIFFIFIKIYSIFDRPLNHDKPQKNFLNCCAKAPQMVTRVKVIKAEGLERQERSGKGQFLNYSLLRVSIC